MKYWKLRWKKCVICKKTKTAREKCVKWMWQYYILEMQTIKLFKSETQTGGSDEPAGISSYIHHTCAFYIYTHMYRIHECHSGKLMTHFESPHSDTHLTGWVLDQNSYNKISYMSLLNQEDDFRKFRNTLIAAPGVSQDIRQKKERKKMSPVKGI